MIYRRRRILEEESGLLRILTKQCDIKLAGMIKILQKNIGKKNKIWIICTTSLNLCLKCDKISL